MLELLQERSGYVPSVAKIAGRICNSVDKKRLEERGEQRIAFRGSWIGDDCYVHLQFRNSGSSVGGEARLARAGIDTQGKKISNVTVEVYLRPGASQEELRTTLEHELTHMYDYLQRSLRALDLQKGRMSRSSSRKLDKILDSSIKVGVLDQLEDEIQKSGGYRKRILMEISGCLYMISPLEQNAFIAQIRSELQNKARELKNYRKASEIVEHTQAWKNFKTVEIFLGRIERLREEADKALVVKWCSAFFDGGTPTFEKSVKRLEFEIDRFSHKILVRLGKMCGELYQNSEEFLKEFREGISKLPPYPYNLEGLDEDLEEE